MNIQQLINHRKSCPICEKSLTSKFYSETVRCDVIKYDNGRYHSSFLMSDLNHKKTYEITYSFDDDSFYIDFKINNKEKNDNYKYIPLSLINEFYTFSNRLSPYSIIIECINCNKYLLESMPFNLSKNATYNLEIDREIFGLSIHANNEYKNFVMNNYTNKEFSDIVYWKSIKDESMLDDFYPVVSEAIILPIIEFISGNETAKRVNSLLTFS